MITLAETTFPEVASSPWATVLFSLGMFSILYYMSSGLSKTIDPIMFYLVMGIWLVIVFIGTIDYEQISKVVGFKEPYPGFNVLLAVMGFGIGGILYLLVSKGMVIFEGNKLAMSMIQPFYVPLALPQFSVSLGIAGVGSAVFYLFVALFEEGYKILGMKNIVNWLETKGISVKQSALGAFIAINVVWALQHYFSWTNLNIGAVFFAVFMGTVFWFGTYGIFDMAGILTPETVVEWTGVLLSGAITSHLFYDWLITEGVPLPRMQFLIVCIALIVIPVIGAYIIKKFSPEGKSIRLR